MFILPKLLVKSEVKIALGGTYRFTVFLHTAVINFGGTASLLGGPIALPGFCSCPWILSLPALGFYTTIKAVTHIGDYYT